MTQRPNRPGDPRPEVRLTPSKSFGEFAEANRATVEAELSEHGNPDPKRVHAELMQRWAAATGRRLPKPDDIKRAIPIGRIGDMLVSYEPVSNNYIWTEAPRSPRQPRGTP